MKSRLHRDRSYFSRAAVTAGALVLGALGLVLSPAMAGPPVPGAPEALANRYIGASKCMNCHKTDATGNQYGKWEQMKHAHAFETLGTDKAKELGKAKGIDDPQKAKECLTCHVTAYGAAETDVAKGFKPEMGVQCESCHGPGESHMKARVAAAAKGGEVVVAEGEIVSEPRMDTCVKCHNPDSPSYKPFCFFKMNAQIAHLNPTKKRTDEQLKAILNPNGCTDTQCNCPKPTGSASSAAPSGTPAAPEKPAAPDKPAAPATGGAAPAPKGG